jgi:hypothetical protein
LIRRDNPRRRNFNELLSQQFTIPGSARESRACQASSECFSIGRCDILRATYMDDSLDAADSETEAIRLYNELVEL